MRDAVSGQAVQFFPAVDVLAFSGAGQAAVFMVAGVEIDDVFADKRFSAITAFYSWIAPAGYSIQYPEYFRRQTIYVVR